MPRDSGREPADLVKAYLDGTPFAALVETPVPFSMPDRLRPEHALVVATIATLALKAAEWFPLGRLLIVRSSFAGTSVPAVRQTFHSSCRPKLWSHFSRHSQRSRPRYH